MFYVLTRCSPCLLEWKHMDHIGVVSDSLVMYMVFLFYMVSDVADNVETLSY